MIEQAWNYKSVVAKDSNNTGGSGSGSGGGEAQPRSSWRYFDLRSSTMTATHKKQAYAMLFHIGKSADNAVAPIAMFYSTNMFESMVAVGVDTEGLVLALNGTIVTMGEYYNTKGLFGPNDIWAVLKDYGIIEITEDEFLNLT